MNVPSSSCHQISHADHSCLSAAYGLWSHHLEVILHEPSRHEEHALNVQGSDVFLNLCFAVKMFYAGNLTGSHNFYIWKRRPYDLDYASTNTGFSYGFALGYLHSCGTLLPV